MPRKPHDDIDMIGAAARLLCWLLWLTIAIGVCILVVGCQHPATGNTTPPFPHKGLTWEYNPNDPRLVLVAEDYLIYKR